MKSAERITFYEWLKKVRRNRKTRERYFKKRYGNLDRMNAIDKKLQEYLDDESLDDEIKATENNYNK